MPARTADSFIWNRGTDPWYKLIMVGRDHRPERSRSVTSNSQSYKLFAVGEDCAGGWKRWSVV